MNKIAGVSVLLAGLGAAAFATPSLADGYHGGYHGYHGRQYNDYPGFGARFSFLPHGCATVRTGDESYYYRDGIYYNREHRDYVVIAPPVGVIVRSIPSYYSEIIINGVPYYTSDGVYYVYTRRGYQVVPAPLVQPTVLVNSSVVDAQVFAPVAAQPNVVAVTTTTENSDEVFTINIPDKKGGYTPVIIKRSKDGFVGPQGEFYQEFPKVSQLQLMYAK